MPVVPAEVASGLLPSSGRLRLFLGPDLVPPRVDIGVGPALLAEVAVGGGGYLRIYRPAATTAFSRRDALAAGFSRAVRASAGRGFTPVLRAAGGRAAVYDDGSLCLDWVGADPEPRSGQSRRFEQIAALLVEALTDLAVPAEIGPVPGEYCPGSFSVRAGGRKLAGSAQRLVRGGWFAGTVLVVTGSDRLREVVAPVYEALDLPCDERTVGAVEDLLPGITTGDVLAAVLTAAGRLPGADVPVAAQPDLLTRAKSAAPDHPALKEPDLGVFCEGASR